MSESVLCIPLNGFIVSDLTFGSLIYFEFTFVYGVREGSNFIFFLHVAVQFLQHQLVKRLSFPIVHFCRLCHTSADHRCMDLSLDFLSCFIALYFCFVPVLYGFDTVDV